MKVATICLFGCSSPTHNPRSIYEPFCDVAALLMRHFDCACHCGEAYPPEMRDAPHDITSGDWLRDILIPSMDYNRAFWEQGAQTTDTAILRPGDAVARFVTGNPALFAASPG